MAVAGREMTLKLIDCKSDTLRTAPPHGCMNTKITGFSLSCLQKIPGLFQDFHDPQNIFTRLCHSPATFTYTDKQQLFTLCMYSVTVHDHHDRSSQVAKNCAVSNVAEILPTFICTQCSIHERHVG